MAKILLKFGPAVVREIPITKLPLTIGRKPDNDLVIDNPTVSSHHARIAREAGGYIVEDLNSLNGTFLTNRDAHDKKIIKAGLKDGDQVIIGKHTLVFVDEGGPVIEDPKMQKTMGETMVLEPAARPKPQEGREQVGYLKVVEGGVGDQGEVTLSALITYIGKAESAGIRIKGMFAPDIAAIVSRRPEGYLLKAVKEKYPKVNGKELEGERELKNGDVIEAGSTKMVFGIRGLA